MMTRTPPTETLLVLVAATLWGSAGLFVRELVDLGLSPLQVVYYANGLGFLALLGGLALRAPRYLRVSWRMLLLIVVTGVVGGRVSFVCWASAIALSGVSLTTLLTATAPAWVTLLAWRWLGEPVGRRRLLVLGAAVLGCGLVARAYDPAALRATLAGVLFGLGSGFTYGLYTVLGKRVLEAQHPVTVTVYSLGGAAFLLLPLQAAPLPTALPAGAWPWLALFVGADILLGPLAYYAGLRTLPAGVVGLLTLWEPIVGVLAGVLALHEVLELPQVAGALLVVASGLALRPGERGDPSDGGATPAPAPAGR